MMIKLTGFIRFKALGSPWFTDSISYIQLRSRSSSLAPMGVAPLGLTFLNSAWTSREVYNKSDATGEHCYSIWLARKYIPSNCNQPQGNSESKYLYRLYRTRQPSRPELQVSLQPDCRFRSTRLVIFGIVHTSLQSSPIIELESSTIRIVSYFLNVSKASSAVCFRIGV